MKESENRMANIFRILSERLREPIMAMKEAEREKIQEFRLRLGREFCVTICGKSYMLSRSGQLTAFSQNCILCTAQDIDYTFQSAFQYSLHSFSRELSQGYITISGGNRVSFCGAGVCESDKILSVRDISSINIRVAREQKGCADEIINRVFLNSPQGLLIAGKPSSGKTTVLRDLTRQLGNIWRVSCIDERCEIAASCKGESANDVGRFTDVFSGYPKAEGVMIAVRTMSPDIIICDEIGSDTDERSLLYILNSGVKLVATTHASSIDEACCRKSIARLIGENAFDYSVLLGVGENLSKPLDFRALR